MPIAVVNGAGGLGKTTLAVHAAHRVRAQFPDGQLYVDLLGASAQPAEPGEVLARFLRDLGVEGDKVPAHDDERAALYRTRLTGRRVLILLDNARDAAQVRQLLPGSSSCAVLVTTRNRTPDLVSTRFVDLNVLEDTEALALFSRWSGRSGRRRSRTPPPRCSSPAPGCRWRSGSARRGWRRAGSGGSRTLAARLRNEHRRLDELSIGDLAVRASFQVSYDSLRSPGRGVDPARVFRLLGLWQGSSISLAAAAALVGAPEDDTADALETLVDANLLESPAPDWYRFHDLLRVYATERAQAEESESARSEAVRQAAALVPGHGRGRRQRGLAAAATRCRANRRPTAATAGSSSPAWRTPWPGTAMSGPTSSPPPARPPRRVCTRSPGGCRRRSSRVFNRRSNWADCVTTHRVAADSGRARPGTGSARPGCSTSLAWRWRSCGTGGLRPP